MMTLDKHTPALDVWSTNVNLSIKTARPHQRRIQNVDTVCCGEYDDI